MKNIIVLAVDAARQDLTEHVAAAAEATRQLARDTGDQVVVLHVHEFAYGRFGRIQVDCVEGDGEQVVDKVVAGLEEAGISVSGVIRTTSYGHVAKAILAAADEFGARLIVLGSSSRTDLPHLPFGSVSNRLLHLARRPVLIVPKGTRTATAAEANVAEAAVTA